MIKEFVIDNNDNITSEIVDNLNDINLSKDVLISCIYHPEMKIIRYDIDSFVIKNDLDLFAQKGSFKYQIPMKLSLPLSIHANFISSVKGLVGGIFPENIQKGIILDFSLAFADDITLNLTSSDEEYSIYNGLTATLQESDHATFISNREFIGMRIPKGNDIFNLRLMMQLGKTSNSELNNIYIIHSNYIYERFPDM